DANNRVQKRMVKKTRKIIERYNGDFRVEEDIEQKDRLWKIRHSAASVVSYQEGNTKALPIIEDGIVPVDKLNEYIIGIYAIFERLQLSVAVWGHAGSGNLHMQPMFDISQLGDRQKIFRLLEDYHQLVVGLGGSISAEHGDGRIRGPYLPLQFGSEYYDVLTRVKSAFDPHGTLNPGVKIGITSDDIKPLLRSEYSISHLYDHLPRS
ncbi:MAG: hypothetical protein M3Q36_00110, partial [bacterium]|nr:hypothetical protein [bacterium]